MGKGAPGERNAGGPTGGLSSRGGKIRRRRPVPRASAAAHPVAEGKNDGVTGRTVTRADLAFRWDGHRRGQRSKAKGKRTSAAANATGGFNHGWKGRSARSHSQKRRRQLRASVLSNPLAIRPRHCLFTKCASFSSGVATSGCRSDELCAFTVSAGESLRTRNARLKEENMPQMEARKTANQSTTYASALKPNAP